MIHWKILTWRKLFPSSGLGGWNKSRKRRLRSFSLTYKGMTLSPLGLLKQGPLASVKFFFKFNLPSIFTKKLVENHEYRIKDLKVRVSRQANYSQFTNFNSCFRFSRKVIPFHAKTPLTPSENNTLHWHYIHYFPLKDEEEKSLYVFWLINSPSVWVYPVYQVCLENKVSLYLYYIKHNLCIRKYLDGSEILCASFPKKYRARQM